MGRAGVVAGDHAVGILLGPLAVALLEADHAGLRAREAQRRRAALDDVVAEVLAGEHLLVGAGLDELVDPRDARRVDAAGLVALDAVYDGLRQRGLVREWLGDGPRP